MGPCRWDPPKIFNGKKLKIGPENSNNYPPLEFTNLIDYPPSKSGRKTPSTTPPSNSRTSSTTPPPSKSGRKTPSTTPPPSNSRTSSTTPPPSKSGRKTPSTTPPRIHEPHRLPPPPRNRFGPPQLLKRGGAPETDKRFLTSGFTVLYS